MVELQNYALNQNTNLSKKQYENDIKQPCIGLGNAEIYSIDLALNIYLMTSEA